MYSRYNLGQVAVGIGDLGLAYQCFKIATSVDPNHSESYNNLGVYFLSPLPFCSLVPLLSPLLTHLQVLDMRKSNLEQARSNFRTASNLGPQLHEPLYNSCNFPSPSPSLSSSSLPPLPSLSLSLSLFTKSIFSHTDVQNGRFPRKLQASLLGSEGLPRTRGVEGHHQPPPQPLH